MSKAVCRRLSRSRDNGILGVVCVLGLAAPSCGKAPPPQVPITVVAPPAVKMRTTVTIQAAPGVNPNEDGRPSPIVVRLYQLRTVAAFQAADFGKLNGSDQATLGQDLIRRDEYTLLPGADRQVELELPDDAAALCAMAAFQRLDTAIWRACVDLPASVVAVTVDDARITVATKGS